MFLLPSAAVLPYFLSLILFLLQCLICFLFINVSGAVFSPFISRLLFYVSLYGLLMWEWDDKSLWKDKIEKRETERRGEGLILDLSPIIIKGENGRPNAIHNYNRHLQGNSLPSFIWTPSVSSLSLSNSFLSPFFLHSSSFPSPQTLMYFMIRMANSSKIKNKKESNHPQFKEVWHPQTFLRFPFVGL